MPSTKDSNDLKAVFSNNLKLFMEEKDCNTAELARALSTPFTTVSDWVHGRKYPRMDKVQALADYFGVLKSDLTEERTGLPPNASPINFSKYHSIPILGRIAAGLPIYAEQNIEGYALTDLNGGAEYFALRVVGDSMNAARIQEGDLLIVRRQKEVENGEIAVVMVNNDDATVKRFYASSTTITLVPQSTNPTHQPQIYDLSSTTIDVIGKVVKVEFSI